MESLVLRPGLPGYLDGLEPIGSPTLFMRGRLPNIEGVAIVGTRRPTPEALAFTRELTTGLVAARLAVWSGGAIGIDAEVHRAALAAGGATVVVTGGGLDRPYPTEHAPLFDEVVARSGALVARVSDDTPPRRAGFLQRNALLAAATVATIVVQAGVVSGARSTAAAARRLGRRLLVVPHAPWDERGAGAAAELRLGARPVHSLMDVLLELGRPPPPAKRGRSPRGESSRSIALPFASTHEPPRPTQIEPPLTADEALVHAHIGAEAVHLDDLCELTSLPTARVAAAVLTLTFRAIVVEAPAGFVRLLI